MYKHFTYFKTQCKRYLLFILSTNIPSLFFNPKSMKIKGQMVAKDSVLDFSVRSTKKIFNIYILYLQNKNMCLLLL